MIPQNPTEPSGAAYVFSRGTDGMWSQTAYIKAADSGQFERFGSSVALSGDWLAIGAPGESSTGLGLSEPQDEDGSSDSGAVYVFFRASNAQWEQRAKIKSSNSEADDKCGARLAMDNETVIFGTPEEDSSAVGSNGDEQNNSARQSGAVYVRRLAR